MPLSDTALRNLKASTRPTKHADGQGLFLLVKPGSSRNPKGSRLWRFKYHYAHKEKSLAFGSYPAVSLKQAREMRDTARGLLAKGIDPSEKKKADAAQLRSSTANTFQAIAEEWLSRQTSFAPVTLKKARALLEKWAFPWIGHRPINEISTSELLEKVLRRVEKQGKIESTHRLKQRCGQIFSYAKATGRARENPTTDMRGALLTPTSRSHAAILEPEKIGELLRAIDGFSGQFVTQCALKLTPLLFVRPGELRRAEWTEINFADRTWTIPAHKMKMRKAHIVPLSRQAIQIFNELAALTGSGQLVFPGTRSRNRPMSENTVNGALRRIGYSGTEIVAHGFRSMASTILNEQKWRAEVIERQLAHVERNEVRRIYNRAEYLDERTEMMQAWADYLDQLRAKAEGTPL